MRIAFTISDHLVSHTTSERGEPLAHLTMRKWFIQDEQRSVRALLDYRGVVVEGYEYDPYGNVLVLKPGSSGIVEFTSSDVQVGINSASSPFLYTGRRYDEESGLMQYRTRYYSIDMGRFISQDTIGVWGDPNSLGNAYTYVGNSPHSDSDPYGMCKRWTFVCKAARASVNAVGEMGAIVWDCLGWTGLAAAGVGVIITILTGGAATAVLVGLFIDIGSEMLICLIDRLAPDSEIGLVVMAALLVVNPEKIAAKGLDDVAASVSGKLAKRAGKADVCPNSFTAETLVLMAAGTWQPISLVQEGDMVWAHDPETGEEGPREVVGLIQGTGSKDLVTLTINGDTLTATAGHPFWSASRGQWIDASEILIGERLLQDDGDEVIVEAVDRYSLVETVYNFEVQGLHTYFVEADGEGVLVHNCKVADARETLKGLAQTGSDPTIRTVASQDDLSRLYDDLIDGADPLELGSRAGFMRPDGIWVGKRTSEKYGDTIDIKMPNEPGQWKVHAKG